MIVFPSSNTVAHGTTSGSLSALNCRNQSGRIVAPARGMRFTPDGSGYDSTFTFGGVPSNVSGITLSFNFYGPTSSTALYTFSIYNNDTTSWDELITNADNQFSRNRWSVVSVTADENEVPNYINNSNQVKIRMVTSSTSVLCNLDQIGIQAIVPNNQFPVFPVGNGLMYDAANEDFNRNNAAQLAYVATKNYCCIQKGASTVTALKAAHPSILLLYYFKLNGVKSTDTLYATAVANDLFMRDAQGNICYNPPNGWYWIDIQNPTKRNIWLTACYSAVNTQLTSDGYMGLRFDNTEVLSPQLPDIINTLPAGYDQELYWQALIACLQGWKAAWPTKQFMFNTYYPTATAPYRGPGLLPYCDGMYFEGFAFKVGGSALPLDRFAYTISDFTNQVSTKIMCAIDYVASSDTVRRIFSLGTYLLCAHPTSYWQLFNKDGGSIAYFSEYAVDIGQPKSAYTTDGTLYYRTYTNGIVIVNPDSVSHDYAVSGTKYKYVPTGTSGQFPNDAGVSYVEVSGTQTIAATSALILRNTP